jgi:hypothetical protein
LWLRQFNVMPRTNVITLRRNRTTKVVIRPRLLFKRLRG